MNEIPSSALPPNLVEKIAELNRVTGEALGVIAPPPQAGYYLTSRVFGEKIHVYLMKDGKLVSSGFSRVNPHEPVSDRTMAQAFSYAAHMAYKHCQWKDEFPDDPQSATTP